MSIAQRSARPLLSLVIAVYNEVRYLEFIVEALKRQTFQDFEIVIADDGSGPDIRKLLDRTRIEVSFPIQHQWQEDVGFRKNVMLNKAINVAQSDYLVFIDGDCMPHHQFLSDHWSNRQSNTVLCGRRMNLSKQLTDRLTLEGIRSGEFEKLSPVVWLDGLMARGSNLEDAIRIENSLIRRLLHRNKARILGCNFSAEKKALESINGFNEDYHAAGIGEDTDIAFRLELTGVRFATLRYLAILYHLFHPATRVGEENRTIFEEVVQRRNPLCQNGLRKLQRATE
ncbi:MAG: glycosyltransferase [Ignavibacteriae bacterium]|nr:glycosyltransferase [Ignavibacteriota bacterium]